MRKDSIKNIRINQEVQKELGELIRTEVKDPRIHQFTSVTRCEVAPDLKTAKVFISCLGSAAELEETVKGLKSAAPFLRNRLAAGMNLRNTPELRFIADDSIAYGIEMSKRIDEIAGVSGGSADLEEPADLEEGEDEYYDGESATDDPE